MDYIRKTVAYLRSESSIESIMKLRLLLGHYYHSRYPTYIDYLFRFYVASFAVTVFIIMVLCVTPQFYFSRPIFIVIDFFCTILISYVSGEGYYLKFYAAVRNIDEISGYRGPFISLRSYASVFLVLAVRIFICYFQVMFTLSVLEPLLGGAMALCGPISYILVLIVFDILHFRIKSLRQDLECCIRSDVVPVLNKIDHLKRVIKIYIELLDSFNENNLTMQMSFIISNKCKIDEVVEFVKQSNKNEHTIETVICNLMSVLLIFSFPRLVSLMYVTVENFVRGSFSGVFGYCVAIIFNMVNVCYPCVLAEITIQEIDRLDKYLSSQLVTCEDNKLTKEINLALEILSLRPFKFTILRAISVDGNLPKSFITLCVTYVIVMVQILKFKD